MNIRGKNWLRSGTAAIAVIAMSGPALTQDSGGTNATLSLSQGLVSSSDDGTFGRTSLGFDLSSVTQTQDLRVQLSGGLEERLDDGVDVEVTNPIFNLSYGIQNKQSALNVGARYRRTDVDTLTTSDDPLSNLLVLDSGTRERTDLSLGYSFGREAPFGGTFSANYDTIRFSDTTDTSLFDQDRTGASLDLRFAITPRIDATLGYFVNDTDRSGTGRDVRRTRLRAGADLLVSETLTADLSVGFTTVDITASTGTTTQQDGVVFGFDLRQTRPSGALTFSLDSSVTETGRRSNISVGSVFQTRNDGRFTGRIGLTHDENGNTNPLYQISYSDNLARGAYTVFLNQNITSSDQGEDAVNTRAGLEYTQALTSTTNLDSGLNYQSSNDLDGDSDTSRINVSLGLSRRLTQDWSVSSRYTYTVRDRGGDSDSENRIFLGLETSFGWRP